MKSYNEWQIKQMLLSEKGLEPDRLVGAMGFLGTGVHRASTSFVSKMQDEFKALDKMSGGDPMQSMEQLLAAYLHWRGLPISQTQGTISAMVKRWMDEIETNKSSSPSKSEIELPSPKSPLDAKPESAIGI